MSALAELLGEHAADFRERFFESEVLHAAGAASAWRARFSSAHAFELVHRADARFPSTALASADAEVPPASYRADAKSKRIEPAKVRALHAEGATLVLNDLGKRDAGVALAARALGRELATRVAVNAYLSPAGASGFAPHWDTHDVVVVQVEGRKRWELFETHTPFPLVRFRDAEAPTGVRSTSLVLSPGDALYVPAGQVHAARSLEEASLHLTLGLYPMRVLDAAVEAVAAHAMGSPALRRALREDPSDRDALRDALRAAADDADALDSALEVARETLRARRGDHT